MNAISNIVKGKWTEVLAVVVIGEGNGEEASTYAPCEVRMSRPRKGRDIHMQIDRTLLLTINRTGWGARVRFLTGDFEFICEQNIGNGNVAIASTFKMKPRRARRARPD